MADSALRSCLSRPDRMPAAPSIAEDTPASSAIRLDPRPLALALTAGILLIHLLPALPPWWCAFLVAVPAFLPWRGRLLWSALALGMLLSQWQGQRWLDNRWPESRQGEAHVVEGRIVDLPARDGDAVHFLFAPADPSLPRLIRV